MQGENGKAGDGHLPLDKRKPSMEEVDLDDAAVKPAENGLDAGKLVQASHPQDKMCWPWRMSSLVLG